MSKYIKPPKSSECKWRSGPPPAVGWWPASMYRFPEVLRWWDGKAWSTPADCSEIAKDAATAAARRSSYTPVQIKWSAKWWLK